MKHFIFVLLVSGFSITAQAQKSAPLFKGMYIQWGYNTEWYTRSNINFKMANGDNFTLHRAKAHDKPDMDAILKKPLEVSIPQYNYRMGFYLDKKHHRALELNFDHIKYVVTDEQQVRVSGTIGNVKVDADSILNGDRFLHLEHTDGGNLLHLNYVQQNTLAFTSYRSRPLVTLLWKAGAGINIPRTDFTYRGDQLNNDFHIAGYNVSAEAGARIYPTRKLFLEFTAKSGFVNYVNALANTNQLKGSRVNHQFGYFELVGLIGYDINF